MEVQAFLLCDSVVQDAHTGKTIVHGIFDRLSSKTFPAVHPSCAIFFRIRCDNQGDHSVIINVVAPSNMRQQMPTLPVRVGPTNVAQGTIHIQGLPLPVEGRYEFELLFDGQRLAGYMLDAIAIGESHGSVH
jgi:hypothetical protein